MRNMKVVGFLFVLWASPANAALCPAIPKTVQDLLVCIEDKALEVQSARLDVEQARAGVSAAGEWSNPELSVESFQGRETDVAVGIPLEFTKRSARTAAAEKSLALVEAKLFQARAKVKIQSLLKLHRLRQAIHEREIVEEAIETFGKLLGQYAKRPGLSPEQTMTSSVFQLSKSDYQLRRSQLSEEIAALESEIQIMSGVEPEKFKSAIPQSLVSWPALKAIKSDRVSPARRIFEAELAMAVAELSVARSESWPTLTVGPSWKIQTESGQTNNLVGINIRLPLPVFNINGGARAVANAAVRRSETIKEGAFREEEVRRERLRQTYSQIVKALENSLSHSEIEKRHRDTDRLFLKGVVPSALVIEAHRTSLELEKSRHERELKALEAYLDFQTLEGTILEAQL